MTTRLTPALLGIALIVLDLVAYRFVSPTVGGPFFERHPTLRSMQRTVPPLLIALVGLGVLVAALVS